MSEPERVDFEAVVDRIRRNAKQIDTTWYDVETDEQRHERLVRRMAGKVARWRSRLPKLYESATLDLLDAQQQPDALRTWIRSASLTLFLAGPMGTGKTFAAYAISAEVVSRPAWVEVWNVVELLDALLPGGEAESTWAAVLNCDLLVLDDLGAPKVTDWAAQAMYRIADARVRDERRQVVTTNGSYDELVRMWGGPTVDRLSYMSTSVVLAGESRRKARW